MTPEDRFIRLRGQIKSIRQDLDEIERGHAPEDAYKCLEQHLDAIDDLLSPSKSYAVQVDLYVEARDEAHAGSLAYGRMIAAFGDDFGWVRDVQERVT